MDRFSFIAVDVSLHALMVDPTLHARFREGGETIIFKANDYADAASSEIFRILKTKPELRDAANNFERVCGGSISQVPTLEDFLAGKSIPAAKFRPVRPAGSPEVKPVVKAYISAFDVFSTTDFAGVMRNVGNKIELVGRIEAVKHGVGKRGRGIGKPTPSSISGEQHVRETLSDLATKRHAVNSRHLGARRTLRQWLGVLSDPAQLRRPDGHKVRFSDKANLRHGINILTRSL